MNRIGTLCTLLMLSSLAVGQSVWTPIGPAPIQDNVVLTNTPNATESGLVSDIAIDPSGNVDSVIYIAAGSGGVWKTQDGGQSWSPLTDFMPSLSIGAVALDFSNPQTVYAGTCVGAVTFVCPNGLGVGIYRSDNGGATWNVLNPNRIFTGISIKRIISPASGMILVATSQGLYKSRDYGQNFGNNSPSYNNGKPIAITLPSGSLSNGFISDLKSDTAIPGTIYAAVSGQGIFKSTDYGSSFPPLGEILASNRLPSTITSIGFVAFAQSTQPDNKTLYATVGVLAGQPLGPACSQLSQAQINNAPALAMFKSVDSGATWTRVQLGPEIVISLQQGYYDQTIGVDPQSAKLVYIGLRALFLSTDGGATGFRDLNQSQGFGCPNPTNQDNRIDIVGATGAQKAHSDQHAIAFSPRTHFAGFPTRVFTGNDGGFASTAFQGSVPGAKWQLLNNQLATALVYGLDVGRGSALNNSYSYAGLQDNGVIVKTPSQNGSNNWQVRTFNDANGSLNCCSVAVDPLQPLHAIAILDGCFSSTTNALNWVATSPCNSPKFPNGTNPLDIVTFDPNGGIAYSSAGPQLFQSKDSGNTFALMASFSRNITRISQVNSNTIWLGFYDGTLAVTNNALAGAGAVWTPHTVSGAPLNQPVSGIAIDPTSEATLVVVYPGFSQSADPPLHVFLSPDNGRTWNNISGTPNGGDNNLPDLPLNTVIIVPSTTPHTVVVGGDGGVMQSGDLGQTWQILGTQLPSVTVNALSLDASVTPPLLRAGTYGRSVFELSGPFPPQGCFVWILTCGHQATLLCDPLPDSETLVLEAHAPQDPPGQWTPAGFKSGSAQYPATIVYDGVIDPTDDEFQACSVFPPTVQSCSGSLPPLGCRTCVDVPHSAPDLTGCPGGPPKPPPPPPWRCVREGCQPKAGGGCLCQ